jgi:predicted nucleic acid-binding Zn ribbon protein
VSERRDTKGPVEPTDEGRTEGGSLGSILREAMGHGTLRGGLALGRLVRGWDQVVGPQLAAQTAPRDLRNGELVVAASSPAWAVQVRFLAREVASGANRALASTEVRSVRVVVHPEASKPLRDRGSGTGSPGPQRRSRGPSSDRI